MLLRAGVRAKRATLPGVASGRIPRLAIGAAAVLAFAGPASAGDFKFSPYGSADYLYDSNVYRFSHQVAAVTGTTDTADRIQRYTAGLDLGYLWQQQELRTLIEGRRFLFQDFKDLDHDEYAFGAALDSAILSNTKGLLNFRDERRMASFEDRRTTQLTMEQEQTGRAALSVAVMPNWHVLTGARAENLRSPLPAAPALPLPPPGSPARRASPNFGMHQAAFNAGVQYGIENKEHPEVEAPLLIGANLEYQTVSFTGVTPPPPPPPGVTQERFEGYRLLTLEATTLYTVSGLSRLDGKLGASEYRPTRSTAGDKPDLTGDIGYIRALSAATELNVHLFRRIVAKVSTADASTDTGASLGAKWEPLLDLKVLADYSYSNSAFKGLSSNSPENAGRRDKVNRATLSIGYPLLRVFGVRLFGAYEERDSNLAFDNFVDKIVGIELSFRWTPPQ